MLWTKGMTFLYHDGYGDKDGMDVVDNITGSYERNMTCAYHATVRQNNEVIIIKCL